MSRVQLQGLFKNTALASSAIVEQVKTLAGLDVTALIRRGTGHCWHHRHRKAVHHSGEGVASRHRAGHYFGGGKAAFQDGIDMVTSHGEANHQAIQIPVHKVKIARFINKDLKDWSTAFTTQVSPFILTGTSRRGSTNCHEWWFPPGQGLAPILTLVGWSTPTFTKNRSHLVTKEGVRSNVRTRTKKLLSFRASVGPSGKDACSSEREIHASTATTRPTNSKNRRKAEEAPVAAHTRNPRLVFARYRSIPRRETRQERKRWKRCRNVQE